MEATVDSGTCTGLVLARGAVATFGQVSNTTIGAQLRIGSFARPIPADVHGALTIARALINLAMEDDPRILDDRPTVETAFGVIPLGTADRCERMQELARTPPESDGGVALQLLRAAAALDERLRAIDELFLLRREVIWQAVRDAEWAACDLLGRYLLSNLETARMERLRYFDPANGQPRVRSSSALAGLDAAVRRVRAARTRYSLDDVKREQTVVECVGLAISANAIQASLSRGHLMLDEHAWRDIAYANGLVDQARRNRAEAMASYLAVLRREAMTFPVILVLDHESAQSTTLVGLARDVGKALDEAEAAIGNLMASGVNAETFHFNRRFQDLTLTGMAEQIAESEKVSVWKLPFFMERALLGLPSDQANVVRRMLHFAADVESGSDIKNSLKLFGMETAMMVAPLTGYVGVALAFAWSLFTLGKSIHEYSQLKTLFEASIDPAVILLGDEQETVSRMGIFLDLLGLIVV